MYNRVLGPRGTINESMSVLSKGSKLDFYDQDDELITKQSPVKVKDKENKERKVDHVQMLNKGKNLLLLTPEKRNLIMRMDTEYGKTLDQLVSMNYIYVN